MVRSRCYLSYQRLDPEVANPEDLENPLLILRWPKGNYAGRTRDLEIECSADPDGSEDDPPIFVPISAADKGGESLFFDVIDALNNEGSPPRPSSTGRSKALFAPVLVYQHHLNRTRGRRTTDTAAQPTDASTPRSCGRSRLAFDKIREPDWISSPRRPTFLPGGTPPVAWTVPSVS